MASVKIQNNLRIVHDCHCPGRGSNQAPSEQNSGALSQYNLFGGVNKK
jgi:hypothetical protein